MERASDCWVNPKPLECWVAFNPKFFQAPIVPEGPWRVSQGDCCVVWYQRSAGEDCGHRESMNQCSVQETFSPGKKTFTNEPVQNKVSHLKGISFIPSLCFCLWIEKKKKRKKIEARCCATLLIFVWEFEICSPLQKASFLFGKKKILQRQNGCKYWQPASMKKDFCLFFGWHVTAANHFKGKASCYEQMLSELTDKALNSQAFKSSFLLKFVILF